MSTMSAAQVEMRAPPISAIGGFDEPQHLQRVLLLPPTRPARSAPRKRMPSATVVEHRREHHLAGHLAHQQDIDQNADHQAQDHRRRDRRQRDGP